MILGVLADLVVGLLAALVLVGPAIRLLLPAGAAVEGYPGAVGVALAGLLAAGLTGALLGWLPLLGAVLSPLAWTVVVRWLCRTDWPTALGIGAVAWLLSAAVYAL